MATNIECFLVFDGAPSKEEGGPATIFYSKTSSEEAKHFSENQAGIFLTLIKFAKFFTGNVPADYALTQKHEIALMSLHDNIWLSVTKANKGHPNRELLIAILSSCKRLFQLFFRMPERDNSGQVTRKSARMMKSSFEQIVLAVSQTNLTFIHLFDSYFQLSPPREIKGEIESIVETIKEMDTPIHNIAIMHSRSFLFSNFPSSVTQTLAFSLQMKFPYLFPRVLMKDDEHLYWIIGLSRSEKGPINVYAPPILFNGETYPLIALKYKKYKIIISLKQNTVPTPEILNTIPGIIKPLRSMFNRVQIESTKSNIQEPFIIIENKQKKKSLYLINQKISDASIPIAEEDIIRGYHFAHMIGKSNTTVGFTGATGYFMYYNNTVDLDRVVLTKTGTLDITESLEKAKLLQDPQNVQTIKIIPKRK